MARIVLANCSELSKEAQSQIHQRPLALHFCIKCETCTSRFCSNEIREHLCWLFSTPHVTPVTQDHPSPEKAPKLLFLPSILALTDLLAEPLEHSSALSVAGSNHDPSGELKVAKFYSPPQEAGTLLSGKKEQPTLLLILRAGKYRSKNTCSVHLRQDCSVCPPYACCVSTSPFNKQPGK